MTKLRKKLIKKISNKYGYNNSFTKDFIHQCYILDNNEDNDAKLTLITIIYKEDEELNP